MSELIWCQMHLHHGVLVHVKGRTIIYFCMVLCGSWSTHPYCVFTVKSMKLRMTAVGSRHKLHIYRVLTAGGSRIQFARRDLQMAPCWMSLLLLHREGNCFEKTSSTAQVCIVRFQVQTKFALKRNLSKKPWNTLRK